MTDPTPREGDLETQVEDLEEKVEDLDRPDRAIPLPDESESEGVGQVTGVVP